MTAMVQVRLMSGPWQRTWWVPTDTSPRVGEQVVLREQRWTVEAVGARTAPLR